MGITFIKSSSSKNTIDAVIQAQSDVHAALNDLRATQDAEVARVISNARTDAANYDSATNLIQTSGVPGTYDGTWVVKPTKG
jgi:hypothetical protein